MGRQLVTLVAGGSVELVGPQSRGHAKEKRHGNIGAKLDVWQATPDGLYDSQHQGIDEMRMRGIWR